MIKKEEGGDWIKQERDPSNQIIVKGMEGEEIILLPSASNDYITSNRLAIYLSFHLFFV